MSNQKPLSLTERETRDLEELSQMKRYNLRSKIILFSNLGLQPSDIAIQLNCHIQTVWTWKRKWCEAGFVGLKLKTREEKPEVLEWKNQVLETVDTRPQELASGFSTWSISN